MIHYTCNYLLQRQQKNLQYDFEQSLHYILGSEIIVQLGRSVCHSLPP